MLKSRLKISCLISVLLGFAVISGCSKSEVESSLGYTFSVDTGDDIEIVIDTTDGYSISSDVPFVITKDDEELSQGAFIYQETYDEYVTAVEMDDAAELLDSGTKDGNDFIFWSYNDSEFNYAIEIKGSDTAIIIGNVVSEDSAEDCFERLTIEVSK